MIELKNAVSRWWPNVLNICPIIFQKDWVLILKRETIEEDSVANRTEAELHISIKNVHDVKHVSSKLFLR